MKATKKVHVNVSLTYSYKVVKLKSFETVNKTEERVTMNGQNKADKPI